MQSIRSLRRYNATVPVYLILYNGASAELMEEADRRGVAVHYVGDYCAFLSGLHVRGSILALFPTFHKFLSLTHGPMHDVSQILYLDCDTFFFDVIDGGTGILVPPANADALAQALAFVLTDVEAANSLGQGGRWSLFGPLEDGAASRAS